MEGYGNNASPGGEGSQHAGKLPSIKTLAEIKERVLLDQMVKKRVKAKKLMQVRSGHDGHHNIQNQEAGSGGNGGKRFKGQGFRFQEKLASVYGRCTGVIDGKDGGRGRKRRQGL